MEDSELLKVLYLQNPWWEGKLLKTPLRKRREFQLLKKALSEKQITAIIGPRRVGKSVLMAQLIMDLLVQGVQPKNILFAQLDEPLFDSENELLIQKIIDVYSKYVGGKSFQDITERIYVFFDEVQHFEKWGETLKSYYDRGYPVKFVVSGSSAAGITRGSAESLAGRVSLNHVLTLKFADYARFRGFGDELLETNSELRKRLASALDEAKPEQLFAQLKKTSVELIPKQHKLEMLLSEYMVKGGYVEIIDQGDYAKCAQYLRDLLQLVVYRDIVKVFDIRNPKNMEDLLMYLGSHSSEQFSKNNMAPRLKMKAETIGEYIDYLEYVFLIDTSMIYANSRAKQLRNPKKVYLCDCGIRNMLNGMYSQKALSDARDVGLMAETLIHSHLHDFASSTGWRCDYWKNRFEIDNVIARARSIVPVEVKYQNEVKPDDAAGCIEFIKENKCQFAIMVTKNKLELKDRVLYVPLWLFLLAC